MSWEFLKGDAIRLTFIFKEYDDSGATKLRVFCYGNKGKTYFFGDEFAKNNGEWIAQFESERTSGNAGASVLTAQLLDNDGNLINSANINLLVIESNTTTPFVSSPHFKDDALAEIEQAVADAKVQIDNRSAEIEQAVADAKVQIDNWSDQSNRLANLEQATQDLQIFKSNSGALHCVRYYCWFGKNSTTTQSTANITKSVLFRIVDYDWYKNTTSNASISTLAQVGGYGGNNGFSLNCYYNRVIVQASADNDDGRHFLITVYHKDFSPFLKSSVNDFCIVFKTDANSIIIDARLYLNGNLIGSLEKSGNAWYQNLDAFRFNGGNVEALTYKDVCVFNFDVSDANAPYTLSDYQQGKPIPVECLDTSAEQRALLALENYTIKVGESQKVLDYSGNANDASTVYGTVKGDNDTRISAFVNAITGK